MKTRSVLSGFLLLLCSLINGQDPDTVKFISLGPAAFHISLLKEENAILIDVREFFEYRKSRLKNAVNIPSSGNLEFAADTLDKKAALYLYCTSGFRSKRVAKNFYSKGLRHLYSLEGGIVAWRKEKMPVDKRRFAARGNR